MVPRDDVFYEPVDDAKCVQVPTTQMRTPYKTEYKTRTVPVTRLVVALVPDPATPARAVASSQS